MKNCPEDCIFFRTIVLRRQEEKYVEKLLLPRLTGVEICDILPRPDERTAKRDSVENLQSFFFALQPLYAEFTGS